MLQACFMISTVLFLVLIAFFIFIRNEKVMGIIAVMYNINIIVKL